MAKKAFEFNSTVDSRRLSTLVYHSAHSISNIPPNIRRIFPADRLPHAWPTVDSGAWMPRTESFAQEGLAGSVVAAPQYFFLNFSYVDVLTGNKRSLQYPKVNTIFQLIPVKTCFNYLPSLEKHLHPHVEWPCDLLRHLVPLPDACRAVLDQLPLNCIIGAPVVRVRQTRSSQMSDTPATVCVDCTRLVTAQS
eukprot:1194531-Prorocentrum_minimum.AAC.8